MKMKLNLGFIFINRGSALGQALTWFLMCLAAWWYAMFSVRLDSSRIGWSWSALDDWGHFLKLGMEGYAVLLTDWCAFDMAILIAGYLGVVEQGAVSAALHLEMIGYMIFRGLGTACCIRVGQNLGAGDSEGAKTSYRVSAMLTGSVMVVTGLTILFLKDVLPWLFTTDPTTADLVSRSIPLLVAVMLVDAVLTTKYPECGATESLLNDHCSSYNGMSSGCQPLQFCTFSSVLMELFADCKSILS
ncbi:multidrug and toxin extrusion protein 1-like [Liolophura sinensis]|uniref:multidrug and toxin extrusion protein 1-like n=1 Tax=Liolophura sinensis TaxID=3198878 RepID=UPI003158AF20